MSFEIYILFLFATLMASFSHCIGMCGGIVVGLNMRKFDNSKILQAFANVLYFVGRMCGYIIIGLCFTLIAKNFGFNETARAIILIVLGVLLFLVAFIITFYPRLLGNVSPSGNYAWYKNAFQKAIKSQSIFAFFIVGLLNGFLPCHLVYMASIKAADSLNIWHSILTMFIFSIGTFVPLFLVGIFSSSLLQSSLRKIFLWIAFVIMSYFAFNNIYNGINMLSNSQDSMQHHMDHSMHMMNIESKDMPSKIHIDNQHHKNMQIDSNHMMLDKSTQEYHMKHETIPTNSKNSHSLHNHGTHEHHIAE